MLSSLTPYERARLDRNSFRNRGVSHSDMAVILTFLLGYVAADRVYVKRKEILKAASVAGISYMSDRAVRRIMDYFPAIKRGRSFEELPIAKRGREDENLIEEDPPMAMVRAGEAEDAKMAEAEEFGVPNMGMQISKRKRMIIKPGPVKFKRMKYIGRLWPWGRATVVDFIALATGSLLGNATTTGTSNSQGWFFYDVMNCDIISRFLFTPRYFNEVTHNFLSNTQGNLAAGQAFGIGPSVINAFNNAAGTKSIFQLPQKLLDAITSTYQAYALSIDPNGTGATVPVGFSSYSLFFQSVLYLKMFNRVKLRNNFSKPVIVEITQVVANEDQATSGAVTYGSDILAQLNIDIVNSYARDNWVPDLYSADPAPQAAGTTEYANMEFEWKNIYDRGSFTRYHKLYNQSTVRLEPGEECVLKIKWKELIMDLAKSVGRLNQLGFGPQGTDGTMNHPPVQYVLAGVNRGLLFRTKGILAHDNTASSFNKIGFAPANCDVEVESSYKFTMKNASCLTNPNKFVRVQTMAIPVVEEEIAPAQN